MCNYSKQDEALTRKNKASRYNAYQAVKYTLSMISFWPKKITMHHEHVRYLHKTNTTVVTILPHAQSSRCQIRPFENHDAIKQNTAKNHVLPWLIMKYHGWTWTTVVNDELPYTFMVSDHVLLNGTMVFDHGDSLLTMAQILMHWHHFYWNYLFVHVI